MVKHLSLLNAVISLSISSLGDDSLCSDPNALEHNVVIGGGSVGCWLLCKETEIWSYNEGSLLRKL
jgi:hypothetical protein